jgi:hypothetical protein
MVQAARACPHAAELCVQIDCDTPGPGTPVVDSPARLEGRIILQKDFASQTLPGCFARQSVRRTPVTLFAR